MGDPYYNGDALYYDKEPIATNHQGDSQVPLGTLDLNFRFESENAAAALELNIESDH